VNNIIANMRDVNFKVTSFIILSILLFDFLSVYSGIRLSIITRLLLILSCAVGLCLFDIKIKNLRMIGFLFVVIIIQQYMSFIVLKNISLVAMVENFGLILKVLSFPIVLFWFEKMNDKQFFYLKKIIYFSFSCYCISIVISPLLGLSSLLTYGDTGRFGYKGLINAGNETAMVLLIACFWTGQVYLVKKTLVSLLMFSIMLLAALMLGTKAGILIAAAALFSVFVLNFNQVKRFHKVVISVITLSLALYSVSWFWDVLYPMLETSFQYFSSQIVSMDLYGYFSLLISGRDTKLIEVVNQLAVANYMHLIVGGWPVSLFMVEMDYFDMVLLFGMPLGTGFFYCYFHLIFSRLTKNLMQYLFFIVMLTITFLAGHVLFSMVHVPMLAAYLMLSSDVAKRSNF